MSESKPWFFFYEDNFCIITDDAFFWSRFLEYFSLGSRGSAMKCCVCSYRFIYWGPDETTQFKTTDRLLLLSCTQDVHRQTVGVTHCQRAWNSDRMGSLYTLVHFQFWGELFSTVIFWHSPGWNAMIFIVCGENILVTLRVGYLYNGYVLSEMPLLSQDRITRSWTYRDLSESVPSLRWVVLGL